MNTRNISKHDKYRDLNPISKSLVANFFKSIDSLYSLIDPKTILDVGCGEGMVYKSLEKKVHNLDCYAIDLDPAEVTDAKTNLPFANVQIGSAYEIPFEDNFADLVICSEVLEHLETPEVDLKEIYRVSNKYAILTVPNEPLWGILNMVRLKYWGDFGNTPGHLNRWSSSEFKSFVGEHFTVIEEKYPTPWNFLLCEKK